MQAFGQFLLIVMFLATLVTMLTGIAGAVTRRKALMNAARYGVYAVTALNVACTLYQKSKPLVKEVNSGPPP